ncbi:protein GLUTAMINE DUMPER 2-like [Chenopodium quinoa]|uniref:protein GLUTAMINE DUMPER 2-like n=1 Tax=Chenopodium quinoa TaxID=63459 RepID=UPI000B788933|nr:protein GLUTAMINE DUMPER 2-like [Chenopodium quinoa]XP_021762107.1 protein GLUTAMINE DUMPER 2-like [Chenopodium quinoa]
MRMTTTLHATLTPEKTSSFSIAPGATTVTPRSPWHSPVPYLFGGLAAMLGLIAFALLILACSYWRLSRDNDPQQQSNEGGDLESGEKGEGVSKINGAPVFEEKIVVIMAGNDKPTFLATPALMLMPKSNFNDDHHLNKVGNNVIANDENTSVGNDDDDDEKPKEDETSHPHD